MFRCLSLCANTELTELVHVLDGLQPILLQANSDEDIAIELYSKCGLLARLEDQLIEEVRLTHAQPSFSSVSVVECS